MTDSILPSLPDLARIAEVARALNVDRRTVERYIASGRLQSVKLGSDQSSPVRITRESVARFIASCRVRPQQDLRRLWEFSTPELERLLRDNAGYPGGTAALARATGTTVAAIDAHERLIHRVLQLRDEHPEAWESISDEPGGEA